MEVIPVVVAGVRKGMLQRLDPATVKWDTIAVPTCPLPADPDAAKWTWSYRTARRGGMIGVPFAPVSVTKLDPNGGWWCSTGLAYQIKQVDLATGKELTSISLNIPAVALSAASRDSTIALLQQRTKDVPAGTIDLSLIPHVQPRFNHFAVDDQGRLWVFRAGTSGPVIDIWSCGGVMLGTVASPPGMVTRAPVVIRNGHLYVVTTDADDVQYVARYRIAER